MVSQNDMPERDCYGTDLARVREMLARGYTAELIGEALGIPRHLAAYAVVVATGDREGAPSEEELAALCREIQAGWTEEQAVAARHGDARMSSMIVRADGVLCSSRRENGLVLRQAERIESADVVVIDRPAASPERRYLAKPSIQIFGRRHYAERSFRTQDEAREWGRAWMRAKWDDAAHAGACVGR